MKTMDEVLEGWLIRDPISEQGALGAMREVETQTREEMFEFAEYCTVNGCKSLNGFCILDNAENHYFTDIETLFEHWKSLKK